MNKILFSIATLGLVTFSAIGADAQNIYVGARVGANLANQNSLGGGLFEPYLRGDDNTNGMRAGFLAGLQMDRHFSDTWGVSAELAYDQKGTRVDDQQSGFILEPQNLEEPFSQTGTSDLTLNFLEASLFLKVRLLSGDIRPYIFAGPSVGLFLSGKERGNISYSQSSKDWTLDTTMSVPSRALNTFDISAIGGAGVELNLRSDHIIFLDAAYAYGFTNLVPNSDGLPRALSRDIRLAAGILFPLD